MKAKKLDEAFDSGADISASCDYEQATRPNLEVMRVNLDLPAWVLDRLSREAKRSGISRGALLKRWLVEMVDQRLPASGPAA